MATKPDLHPDDARHLRNVARLLAGHRVMERINRQQLGERIGRSEAFVQDMERGEPIHSLSGLQAWAGGFDLRVEPSLEGFAGAGFVDTTATQQMEDEVETMYTMSRKFEAQSWVRLWIVAELTLHRHRLGISSTEMASRLNLTKGSITAWELNGTDPIISKLCTYARALGGQMHFGLIEREDWDS